MRNKIIEAAMDAVVNESEYSPDCKAAFKKNVKNKFDDNATESDLKRVISLIDDTGTFARLMT